MPKQIDREDYIALKRECLRGQAASLAFNLSVFYEQIKQYSSEIGLDDGSILEFAEGIKRGQKAAESILAKLRVLCENPTG